MRSSNLLWGLLLVVIGALLLFQQLGYIYIRWWELWQFWPLILIAWGILILPINRALRAGLALVLFAVVLVLLLNNFDFRYTFTTKISDAISLHHYSEPMEGEVDEVKLSMQLFAGDFAIEDTTDELIDVKTRGPKSSFELMENEIAGVKTLTLSMNESGRDWGRQHSDVNAKISLNTFPRWNLALDAGSANIDLDLRPYKVGDLSLKLNSADGLLRLGAGNIQGKMQVNSCNLKIRFPEESGCEITWTGSGNHSDFEDFVQVEENVYRSGNWEAVNDKIRLVVTANSSSVDIEETD